jgi:hypothetical protein
MTKGIREGFKALQALGFPEGAFSSGARKPSRFTTGASFFAAKIADYVFGGHAPGCIN